MHVPDILSRRPCTSHLGLHVVGVASGAESKPGEIPGWPWPAATAATPEGAVPLQGGVCQA